MAAGQLNHLLHHLRRVVAPPGGAGRSDRQLLEGYLAGRDETAFAALVRRHGPLVLGVCRRVLNNHHDAEDAFQATFLVLAKKAASIVHRERLAGWLYGVAYHTALRARTLAGKRRAREQRAAAMSRQPTPPDDFWNDLQPVLDQELQRLPDKYREAIVLCDLEGKTRKEAAGLLGWPPGTLAGRLARARAALARRLARRGITLSAGALAALLAREAAAGVPNLLVSSTVRAVAGLGAPAAGVVSGRVALLVEGVLKAMLLTKLKTVTALVLVVALLGLTAGTGLFRTAAATAETPRARAAADQEDEQPAEAASPRDRLPLPAGQAPVQILARRTRGGKIQVKMVSTELRRINAVNAAGQPVEAFQRAPVIVERVYDRDAVKAYDTHLKKVNAKDLAKTLQHEVLALAVFGPTPDRRHFRLVKEGTLVFVLPLYEDVGCMPGRPAMLPPSKGRPGGMGGRGGMGPQPANRAPAFPKAPAKPAPRGGVGLPGAGGPAGGAGVRPAAPVAPPPVGAGLPGGAGGPAGMAPGKGGGGPAPAARPPAVQAAPAAGEVQGRVTAVDANSGLVQITLGHDEAVHAGDQLDVYRLKPQASYLGRVRIMEVDGSRAVGERSPHARGTICVGDNVGRVTQRR